MQYQTPAPQGARSTFSFPNLKPQDITQCLAELQIPFTNEDFEKPNPQRMLYVYETFADILMGVTPEQFSNPRFDVLELLEFPEVHADSLAQMGFFKALNKLMTEVGVSDYSLRDFIKPEAGRIRRILSAIINFTKFRESSLGVFERYTTKTDDCNNQCHHLQQMNQDLSNRVNNLRSMRAQDEPAIKTSTKANAALAADLRELKKKQTALTSEIEALKNEKTEWTDQLTNNQLLVTNCQQEITRIQSRIVQNPEKLKEVITEMTNTLASCKANSATLEKKARDLQLKLDAMSLVEQDVLSCLSLMKECEGEMRKAEESMARVARERETVERKDTELKEMSIKDQQLYRQLASAEEKLGRLQQQQNSRRGAAEEKLKALREEYAAIANKREHEESKIDEHRRIAEELESKSSDVRKHMDAEISNIQADYAQMKNAVEFYQSELEQVLGGPRYVTR